MPSHVIFWLCFFFSCLRRMQASSIPEHKITVNKLLMHMVCEINALISSLGSVLIISMFPKQAVPYSLCTRWATGTQASKPRHSAQTAALSSCHYVYIHICLGLFCYLHHIISCIIIYMQLSLSIVTSVVFIGGF